MLRLTTYLIRRGVTFRGRRSFFVHSSRTDHWGLPNISRESVLWDMVDGPMPRGLLGVGDPDVHLIDGLPTMFLGGFTTSFRNRLFRANLADDAPDLRGPWQLERDHRGRARPVTTDAPHGGWDAAGMHTPSYVGPAGGNGARIYYTGRATRHHYGRKSHYSIGVLEHRDGRWQRRDTPVLRGEPPRTSVLEPFVIYVDGRYRMWYQASPHEIGPGEQPDYELRCAESANGLTDWTPSRVFAGTAEGFFDNALARGPNGWVMVLARGSNLHATANFPTQGLWYSTAPHPSPDRADWSPPSRLLDTDIAGTPEWMGRGTFGPALAFASASQTTATVFFTATRANPSWPRLSVQRLAQRRRPPVPAPFYFSIAAINLDLT